MSGDVAELLANLPAESKVDRATCEALDQEIRRGADLNRLQHQSVLAVVQARLAQGKPPPGLFESFYAYAYHFWGEEAKYSEEAKPRLSELVRALKAEPAVAGRVAQLAAQLRQEQEARRGAAPAAAARQEGPTGGSRSREPAREPADVHVARMQAARHGTGASAAPNLELALRYAEEAVAAHPDSPKVLFEAAGCHQLLAEKGTHLSPTDRYVQLKEAEALYLQCLARLGEPPYAHLKGEYDRWRKGLTNLLAKMRRELETLQEQQR